MFYMKATLAFQKGSFTVTFGISFPKNAVCVWRIIDSGFNIGLGKKKVIWHNSEIKHRNRILFIHECAPGASGLKSV